MKNKSYINCYSIDAKPNKLSIRPGINSSIFELIGLTSSAPFLTLNETPICRFAVEDEFKKLDPLLEKCWLAINKQKETFFYRFFYSISDKANNFIYLLLDIEEPEKLCPFLIDSAIFIGKAQVLIKLDYKDYNQCFAVDNKILCLSPQGLAILTP